MRVGWTSPFGKVGGGVDHLGMRVAGEAAYGALLDFTTTVTWRARYFSFYCWLLRRAFIASGGDPNKEEYELDLSVWNTVVKRGDYAYGAASLLADPAASRVAGYRKLRRRVKSDDQVEFKLDHLQNKRGGLDIYAGPMRQLGLLERASLPAGKLFERPFGRGDALADAFEESLSTTGHTQLLEASGADPQDLRNVGEVCGLTSYATASLRHAAAREERELLRRCIVDVERFDTSEAVRNRVLSIGLILRLHSLAKQTKPGLLDFRAFTLLGIYPARKRRVYRFPAAYNPVTPSWALYQAQAFANYALENLLCATLEAARELLDETPSGVPLPIVLDETLDWLGLGSPRTELDMKPTWLSRPLAETLGTLRSCAGLGGKAAWAEPELCQDIENPQDDEQWPHDAALLFLLSVERLRLLLSKHSSEAWTGSTDPLRLPPAVLVQKLDRFDDTRPARAVLRELVLDLCIRQHRRTALRKLAAQPNPDTALFQLDGEHVVELGGFEPGTSNPRYNNAVTFLQDLGYLHADGTPGLTADGMEILATIERLPT